MLDIRAFCHDYNISLIEEGHHHCHQGWIQIHCPCCTNGTHGWHLGFSLTRGSFNCWRCGSHRVWEVLCKLLRDENTARIALGKYRTDSPRIARKQEPKKKTLWTPPDIGPLKRAHYKYLWKRNFDAMGLEETWELKGTKYLSEEWNWRICFPIRDRTERIIAYGGRVINDETKPKYKLSDKENILIDPSEMLYGIHLARDAAVIVEGPTDVWRMGPGAVATLGIDWKPEQAVILKDFSRRYVMYDPEPQAQKRAEELAEWLGMYSGITEIITGLDTDPGKLPQSEADDIMRNLGII